jgi:hypothetical protein
LRFKVVQEGVLNIVKPHLLQNSMEASSYADRLEGLSNARNRQHRIVVALPTTAHAQQFSANAGAQYCIYHSQHPRRRSGQDQFSDSVDLSTRQSSSACMYARDGVVSADLLVRGIYWRIWRYLWVLACWHSYGKSLAAGVTSQASDWPFHGWTPPPTFHFTTLFLFHNGC